MVVKICTKCGDEKNLKDDFHKMSASKDGYAFWCKDCIKKYQRAYRKENRKARNKLRAQWRDRNPEKAAAELAKWHKEHPSSRTVHKHNYNAQKLENGGSLTVEEWEQVKARQRGFCLHCGQREPDIKLTVDHKVPVSKGGTSDISNIQGLCGPCNSRKGVN